MEAPARHPIVWWQAQPEPHEDGVPCAPTKRARPPFALCPVPDQRARRGPDDQAAASSAPDWRERYPRGPLWFGRYTGVTLGSTKRPSAAGGFGLRRGPRPAAGADRRVPPARDGGDCQRGRPLPVPRPDSARAARAVGHGRDAAGHPRDELLDAERDVDAPPRRDRSSSKTRAWLASFRRPTSSPSWSTSFTSTAAPRAARWRWWSATCSAGLGLDADSPQLRVIATSASLSEDSSGFDTWSSSSAATASSFFVTAGQPADPAALADSRPTRRPSAVWPARGRTGCRRPWLPPASTPRPGALGRPRLPWLPSGCSALSTTTSKGWGESSQSLPTPRPRRRESQFVRISSFARCAACGLRSNRECSGVEAQRAKAARSARSSASPRLACDACGSRVLELLYCFSCGDVSLGRLRRGPGQPRRREREKGSSSARQTSGVVSADGASGVSAAARSVRVVLAGRQAHRGRSVVDQEDARAEEDGRASPSSQHASTRRSASSVPAWHDGNGWVLRVDAHDDGS